MAVPQRSNVKQLLRTIEEAQLGYDSTLQGPFGSRKGGRGSYSSTSMYTPSVSYNIHVQCTCIYQRKPSYCTVVYADYTASGK